MKFRLAFAALPLFLAACDDQAMQDFRMPWDKPLDAAPAAEAPAPDAEPAEKPLVAPEVPPTQVPIEVEGTRKPVATAEAETYETRTYSAAGTGWSVDIAGDSATYRAEGRSTRKIAVRRIPYARGVEYVGELDGLVWALNIRGDDCKDASGATLPMTASLRNGTKRLSGCAAPKSDAQTASTPPTAKPAQG